MSHTYTTSFVSELTNGIHDLDTDTLKLALFSSSATPGIATTAYGTSNEVTGTGYSAGGAAMVLSSGYPIIADNGTGRLFKFDDVEWTSSTLTARWGLIYNSSKSDKSVMVLDFGQNRSSLSSTFAVRFPATQPPIIRIG